MSIINLIHNNCRVLTYCTLSKFVECFEGGFGGFGIREAWLVLERLFYYIISRLELHENN